MRVRKKLRQHYLYPSPGKQTKGTKKRIKKWNILAVHTLPTGNLNYCNITHNIKVLKEEELMK